MIKSISTICIVFLLIVSTIINAQGQLPEVPLESNPVLQHIDATIKKDRQDKLNRLFGTLTTSDRSNANCFGSIDPTGQTVYVLSGDTLEICLDTTGFVTFTNLSIDGNFGSVSFEENCMTYLADPGIDLGVGDTIRVELCLEPDANCTIRTFPVVVVREGETFEESTVILDAESDAVLCIDPANMILPSGIDDSDILDNIDETLFEAFNGNNLDSCFLVETNRFAGSDTVFFTLSNEFCITDTFIFMVQVSGDTLALPFLDDFSYEGPYPNELWLDKNAYVNDHWGYQPPTVGFATLDGLDQTGTPYGGGYGRSDFLTSNYLDLSGFTPSSNVYFTCYAQPKGYGYQPNQADSLVVEFKRSNGQWVQIHAFQGIDGSVLIDSLPPFNNYFSFPIISENYLYAGFQFRFVNYSLNSGIRDVWHVDNVKLTANLVPDTTFNDIAFTNIPNDILSRYSSMPWRHFDASMLIDSIDIELYSQYDVVESAESSTYEVRELNSGAIAVNAQLLNAMAPGGVIQPNVPPLEHVFYTNPVDLSAVAGFTGDELIFEMTYNFEVDSENPGLFPAVESNNTVRSQTVFSDYFAYDDGSAESALFVGQGIGEGVAVEFSASEPDVIRGIQIHFPRYINQDNASFNLIIHQGNLGNEIHEQFGLQPFFPDSSIDTLQGYTTMRLEDDFGEPIAIEIPAGDFFIELEQATNVTPTYIGLDKNNPDAKTFQHWKIFGQWGELTNNGAIMLRPVLSEETPGNTPVSELVDQDLSIKIYPNPSQGIVNIELDQSNYEDYKVSVYNALGQQIEQFELNSPQMDFSSFENGVYYLQIENKINNQIHTEKLFILKP